MTEELINAKIESAKQGRKIWLDIKKECALTQDTFVILFPQKGTSCNKYVMKYLKDFILKTKTARLLLLTYDDDILDACDFQEEPNDSSFGNLNDYGGCSVKFRFTDREEAMHIIDYYMLQMFTDKLIIASLDEPAGRNGSNIIGIKGITEEEAVAIGILGLTDVR